MAMEESERSRLRNLQREQERERRRIRDRQRRESMSHEQRERHLARRRRNYQLRRQRAANATMDSQSDQRLMVMDSDDKMTGDERQASTFNSQLMANCYDVACVGVDEGIDKLDAECINLEGFDALAQGSTGFPRRLRLNHVKHLARSLHHRVGELISERCQILADAIELGDAPANCRPLKALRFIHVKRLARNLHSPVKESTGQICPVEEEAKQNLSQGPTHFIGADIAESVQSSNDKGKDELCQSDGWRN